MADTFDNDPIKAAKLKAREEAKVEAERLRKEDSYRKDRLAAGSAARKIAKKEIVGKGLSDKDAAKYISDAAAAAKKAFVKDFKDRMKKMSNDAVAAAVKEVKDALKEDRKDNKSPLEKLQKELDKLMGQLSKTSKKNADIVLDSFEHTEYSSDFSPLDILKIKIKKAKEALEETIKSKADNTKKDSELKKKQDELEKILAELTKENEEAAKNVKEGFEHTEYSSEYPELEKIDFQIQKAKEELDRNKGRQKHLSELKKKQEELDRLLNDVSKETSDSIKEGIKSTKFDSSYTDLQILDFKLQYAEEEIKRIKGKEKYDAELKKKQEELDKLQKEYEKELAKFSKEEAEALKKSLDSSDYDPEQFSEIDILKLNIEYVKKELKSKENKYTSDIDKKQKELNDLYLLLSKEKRELIKEELHNTEYPDEYSELDILDAKIQRIKEELDNSGITKLQNEKKKKQKEYEKLIEELAKFSKEEADTLKKNLDSTGYDPEQFTELEVLDYNIDTVKKELEKKSGKDPILEAKKKKQEEYEALLSELAKISKEKADALRKNLDSTSYDPEQFSEDEILKFKTDTVKSELASSKKALNKTGGKTGGKDNTLNALQNIADNTKDLKNLTEKELKDKEKEELKNRLKNRLKNDINYPSDIEEKQPNRLLTSIKEGADTVANNAGELAKKGIKTGIQLALASAFGPAGMIAATIDEHLGISQAIGHHVVQGIKNVTHLGTTGYGGSYGGGSYGTNTNKKGHEIWNEKDENTGKVIPRDLTALRKENKQDENGIWHNIDSKGVRHNSDTLNRWEKLYGSESKGNIGSDTGSNDTDDQDQIKKPGFFSRMLGKVLGRKYSTEDIEDESEGSSRISSSPTSGSTSLDSASFTSSTTSPGSFASMNPEFIKALNDVAREETLKKGFASLTNLGKDSLKTEEELAKLSEEELNALKHSATSTAIGPNKPGFFSRVGGKVKHVIGAPSRVIGGMFGGSAVPSAVPSDYENVEVPGIGSFKKASYIPKYETQHKKPGLFSRASSKIGGLFNRGGYNKSKYNPNFYSLPKKKGILGKVGKVGKVAGGIGGILGLGSMLGGNANADIGPSGPNIPNGPNVGPPTDFSGGLNSIISSLVGGKSLIGRLFGGAGAAGLAGAGAAGLAGAAGEGLAGAAGEGLAGAAGEGLAGAAGEGLAGAAGEGLAGAAGEGLAGAAGEGLAGAAGEGLAAGGLSGLLPAIGGIASEIPLLSLASGTIGGIRGWNSAESDYGVPGGAPVSTGTKYMSAVSNAARWGTGGLLNIGKLSGIDESHKKQLKAVEDSQKADKALAETKAKRKGWKREIDANAADSSFKMSDEAKTFKESQSNAGMLNIPKQINPFVVAPHDTNLDTSNLPGKYSNFDINTQSGMQNKDEMYKTLVGSKVTDLTNKLSTMPDTDTNKKKVQNELDHYTKLNANPDKLNKMEMDKLLDEQISKAKSTANDNTAPITISQIPGIGSTIAKIPGLGKYVSQLNFGMDSVTAEHVKSQSERNIKNLQSAKDNISTFQPLGGTTTLPGITSEPSPSQPVNIPGIKNEEPITKGPSKHTIKMKTPGDKNAGLDNDENLKEYQSLVQSKIAELNSEITSTDWGKVVDGAAELAKKRRDLEYYENLDTSSINKDVYNELLHKKADKLKEEAKKYEKPLLGLGKSEIEKQQLGPAQQFSWTKPSTWFGGGQVTPDQTVKNNADAAAIKAQIDNVNKSLGVVNAPQENVAPGTTVPSYINAKGTIVPEHTSTASNATVTSTGPTSPTANMPSVKSTGTMPGTGIGDLSQAFEVGKNKSEAQRNIQANIDPNGKGGQVVSSTTGNKGFAYGRFQMDSAVGVFPKFLQMHPDIEKAMGVDPKTSLEGLSTISSNQDFVNKWQDFAAHPERANLDQAGLAQAQVDTIKETDFNPSIKAINKNTGVDISKEGNVLQQELFSSDVTYGKGKKSYANKYEKDTGAIAVFTEAIKNSGGQEGWSKLDDKAKIQAIMQVKEDRAEHFGATGMSGRFGHYDKNGNWVKGDEQITAEKMIDRDKALASTTNPDGTPKTPEQIATDKKTLTDEKASLATGKDNTEAAKASVDAGIVLPGTTSPTDLFGGTHTPVPGTPEAIASAGPTNTNAPGSATSGTSLASTLGSSIGSLLSPTAAAASDVIPSGPASVSIPASVTASTATSGMGLTSNLENMAPTTTTTSPSIYSTPSGIPSIPSTPSSRPNWGGIPAVQQTPEGQAAIQKKLQDLSSQKPVLKAPTQTELAKMTPAQQQEAMTNYSTATQTAVSNYANQIESMVGNGGKMVQSSSTATTNVSSPVQQATPATPVGQYIPHAMPTGYTVPSATGVSPVGVSIEGTGTAPSIGNYIGYSATSAPPINIAQVPPRAGGYVPPDAEYNTKGGIGGIPEGIGTPQMSLGGAISGLIQSPLNLTKSISQIPGDLISSITQPSGATAKPISNYVPTDAAFNTKGIYEGLPPSGATAKPISNYVPPYAAFNTKGIYEGLPPSGATAKPISNYVPPDAAFNTKGIYEGLQPSMPISNEISPRNDLTGPILNAVPVGQEQQIASEVKMQRDSTEAAHPEHFHGEPPVHTPSIASPTMGSKSTGDNNKDQPPGDFEALIMMIGSGLLG